MKSHLMKLHTGMAKFHIGQAKCQKRMAALHKTAAEETYKSAGQIVSDCHESLAGECEDCASEHTSQAEFHIGMAKALGAGIDTHDDCEGTSALRAAAVPERFGMTAARDFKAVRPDGVHMVMPEDGVRLIPRHGGAPIDQSEDPTSAIDALAHPGAEIRKAIIGQ